MVWGWWRSQGALCWVTSSVPAASRRCFRGQSAGGSTFFALGCAAWLPLAIYVVSFVVSGAALLAAINRPLPLLFALALAELLLGMWTAAAAIFFSHLASYDVGFHCSAGIACPVGLCGLSVARLWLRRGCSLP